RSRLWGLRLPCEPRSSRGFFILPPPPRPCRPPRCVTRPLPPTGDAPHCPPRARRLFLWDEDEPFPIAAVWQLRDGSRGSISTAGTIRVDGPSRVDTMVASDRVRRALQLTACHYLAAQTVEKVLLCDKTFGEMVRSRRHGLSGGISPGICDTGRCG